MNLLQMNALGVLNRTLSFLCLSLVASLPAEDNASISVARLDARPAMRSDSPKPSP